MLAGKKVLVAVTGGIAAYKICELIRELRRRHAEVRVMMTQAASHFITPLTIETLSGNHVGVDVFANRDYYIEHIALAQWPDAIIVAPATANTIAKLAHGMADDLVTTTVLATRAPIVIAPAMNTVMWENQATQANIEALRQRDFAFVDPEFGQLASDLESEGMGRLASTSHLLHGVIRLLFRSDALAGVEVVVTAGRTEEFLDPVRMLSNRSTGRMGYALAEMAAAMGAHVHLISGPSELPAPHGLRFTRITSALEMLEQVQAHYPANGVLIMAAAVSDYRPAQLSPTKLKKKGPEMRLELVENPDILAAVAERKAGAIHVGFAVETENGVSNARDKLRRKKLDLIALNDPNEVGAGFATATNRVKLIAADGSIEDVSLRDKLLVAQEILQRVVALRRR